MPDVMTVNDVMGILHIGRNKAYRLFNMKSFPSFRFEDRHYITKKDFEKLKCVKGCGGLNTHHTDPAGSERHFAEETVKGRSDGPHS